MECFGVCRKTVILRHGRHSCLKTGVGTITRVRLCVVRAGGSTGGSSSTTTIQYVVPCPVLIEPFVQSLTLISTVLYTEGELVVQVLPSPKYGV